LNGTLDLTYHCVVYLDVLGQADLLEQLGDLPKTEEERDRMLGLLRETVGFITRLRNGFESFFLQRASESEWIATLPQDQREQVRGLLKQRLEMRFFSDSILISVNLLDDGSEQCTQTNSVLAAMQAASVMHLLSLAVGKALRGGIDVGLATKLDTGEVYGGAVVRAVRLEQTVAGYPRIAVGDSLRDYLRMILEAKPQSTAALMARRGAEEAELLVFRDSDGVHALDFMGAQIKEISDSTEAIDVELIAQVLSFARGEHERFSATGNEKLARRYESLCEYLTSRANIWGLPT